MVQPGEDPVERVVAKILDGVGLRHMYQIDGPYDPADLPNATQHSRFAFAARRPEEPSDTWPAWLRIRHLLRH